MERLGSLDAVFLAIETDTCPMGAGQLSIFEGPAPEFTEVRRFLDDRTRAVPRCRQRVRESWGRLTRPVWVDDPSFDIDRHVHRAELPDPSPAALDAFVERVMAKPLDRSRPLWEMWFVEDAGEGRWAMVGKIHHCMVDGIAGTDLMSVLLGEGAAIPPAAGTDAVVTPSSWEVTWFGVQAAAGALRSRLGTALRFIVHPAASWRRVRDLAAGARALWLQPRRRGSPLTGPVGASRRWVHTEIGLDEVAAVRRARGGSVNDVVLTATALGFRALLQSRGVTEQRDVMTLMPVSTRAASARGVLDNRVAVTHALLPVDSDDPIAVHDALRAHLAAVKASHQSDTSTVLLHSGDLVPNRLAGAIARGVVRAQTELETVTTNVPGPREPVHLCGRPMLVAWPFAPLAGRIRIIVAIWSYCGRLFVGITGDALAASDVAALARGIDAGFRSLLAAATTDAV